MIGAFIQLNLGSYKAKGSPIGYMVTEAGCWEWVGARNPLGYGYLHLNQVKTMAYRHVYQLERGPIPEGADLDHLCRNPSCVRPDHLEPVTHRENVLRGTGASARNARKTHCSKGHEFTAANTGRSRRGVRFCRTCMSLNRKARYAALSPERRAELTRRSSETRRKRTAARRALTGSQPLPETNNV